ncbi:MAG: hypothetical protein NTX76_03045 [Alphaproteobacteria bacterium]|nr:hypothetical protein [Alphaproteobacteria bacterium]
MKKIIFLLFSTFVFTNTGYTASVASTAAVVGSGDLVSPLSLDEALDDIKEIAIGRQRYNQTLLDFFSNEKIPIQSRFDCYMDSLGEGGGFGKIKDPNEWPNISATIKNSILHDLDTHVTILELIENIQSPHSARNVVVGVDFGINEPMINVLYTHVYTQYLRDKKGQDLSQESAISQGQIQNEQSHAKRAEAIELFYLDEILNKITPFAEGSVVRMCRDYISLHYDGKEDTTQTYFDPKLLLLGHEKAQQSTEDTKKLLVSPVLCDEFNDKVLTLMVEVSELHKVAMFQKFSCQYMKKIAQKYNEVEKLIECYIEKQNIYTAEKRKKRAEKKEKNRLRDSVAQSAVLDNIVPDSGAFILSGQSLASQEISEVISSASSVGVFQGIAESDPYMVTPEKPLFVASSKACKTIEESKSDPFDLKKEKIRSDVLEFLEKIRSGESVGYSALEKIIKKMGGTVEQGGKASHRHIEIPHLELGKTIYGGTYRPHGHQINAYPLWLDLGVDVIQRAITV